MKKHIIVIICIILALICAGLFVPALSVADGIALAAIGLAVYGAALYTLRRKKHDCGGCSGCCGCCMNCASRESENKTEESK